MFLPPTTITMSLIGLRDRMASERNVPAVPLPLEAGGHGKSALSRPMRVDWPAARIIAHELVEEATEEEVTPP